MNIIIIVVAVMAGVFWVELPYMFIRENADRKNLSYWQNVWKRYCERKRSGKQKQEKRHYMQDWNPDW